MSNKTPDEIKKGLECCKEDECFGDRENCPYTADPNLCVGVMCADAIALIKQLEAELEDMTARYKIADDCAKKKGEMNEKLYAEIAAVKAERDAAVTFLPRRCHLCKHVGNKMGDAPCPSFSEYITLEECPYWQWCGVHKEN